MSISNKTLLQLNKKIIGQIRFSDVYPEVEAINEKRWWQRTDFDAKLTDKIESIGFSIFEQIPIGFNSWMVNYGLVLSDDLVLSRNERVANQIKNSNHPDLAKEFDEMENGAIVALANYAPRDNKNTDHNQNGSDFYLAITSSGLEIYTTPLTFLSALESRNRILSLYRIPTKNHPEFSGEHEQFRSARIVRSRRHPDHLVKIFEYSTTEELVEAKKLKIHNSPIPEDIRDGYTAFVDKFGNIKLELKDTKILDDAKIGDIIKIKILNNNKEHFINVKKASDLKSADLNQISVYKNCSDKSTKHENSYLVELIVRVDDNPSISENTAIYQLIKQVPDLDIRTAEVSFTK